MRQFLAKRTKPSVGPFQKAAFCAQGSFPHSSFSFFSIIKSKSTSFAGSLVSDLLRQNRSAPEPSMF